MANLFNTDVLKINKKEIPPINLLVTSPPYNVGIAYKTHKDVMPYDKYLEWCEQWISKTYDLLADDGRVCINVPFTINPSHLNEVKGLDLNVYPVAADYTVIAKKLGLKYWRTVIWEKNISDKTCWGSWKSATSPFMRDPSEAILIFYKGEWKRKTSGTSTISGRDFMKLTKNVWKFRPETNSDHPAAFPTALPKNCIQLFSYKGDTVMDCFMGSGTTGESAVRLGRNFVGVEISKDYFTKAKERIEAAELQSSQFTNIWQDVEDEDITEHEALKQMFSLDQEF